MAAWSVARPVILSRVACRVVIVGWTGSSARYLSKYARLWACSGAHEVLILRTSVSMVLYRWRGMAAAAEDVKRIERLHQDTPGLPTVLHIFSTGGYMKAAAIWQQMERLLPPDTRHSLLADIQGIIFDSAPAVVTEDVAVLALQSVFSGMSAEALKRGDKAGPVQAALQTATRLAMRWYLARPQIILREQEVMDSWFYLAPRCPQLYLFSDADPVVTPSEVQRIMRIQASRGVAVSGWKWSSSGHCQHFKQHPEEYAHHVSHFLNNVALRSWVA